jgi:hypothetical protein
MGIVLQVTKTCKTGQYLLALSNDCFISTVTNLGVMYHFVLVCFTKGQRI